MKILVLVDGSTHAHHAFDKALEKKGPEDTLVVATVYPEVQLTEAIGDSEILPGVSQGYQDALKEGADKIAQHYKQMIEEKKVANCEVIVMSSPAPKDGAVEWAQQNGVELIVVGTRGLGAIKKFFLGSFSDYIIHHAHCDVMLVKLPEA